MFFTGALIKCEIFLTNFIIIVDLLFIHFIYDYFQKFSMLWHCCLFFFFLILLFLLVWSVRSILVGQCYVGACWGYFSCDTCALIYRVCWSHLHFVFAESVPEWSIHYWNLLNEIVVMHKGARRRWMKTVMIVTLTLVDDLNERRRVKWLLLRLIGWISVYWGGKMPRSNCITRVEPCRLQTNCAIHLFRYAIFS